MASKKTFMLTYAYVPDMLERRQPYRPDHLNHLEAARARGLLRLAAALTDPVDAALLLLEAETQGEVLTWVASDPYNRAGLIRSATVRELGVVVPAW
jgi:uncharacterized protein YciI